MPPGDRCIKTEGKSFKKERGVDLTECETVEQGRWLETHLESLFPLEHVSLWISHGAQAFTAAALVAP